MWRNYLITTLRNLWKNRNYVLINTFGLGIALACSITAYLLLAYNIEFDSHLDQEVASHLYRVHTIADRGDGQEFNHIGAPYGMGPMLIEEIPGIEDFFRYQFSYGFVQYGDNSFGEGIAFADEALVSHYPLKVLSGSLESFHELQSVIISQKTADKYFSDENPIDKVLTFYFDNQHKIQARVGAVISDVPLNSSISFSVLMRTEHFQDIYQITNDEMGDWRDPSLILVAAKDADFSRFESLTREYVTLRNSLKEDAKVRNFKVESFTKPINEDDIGWTQLNVRISNMPIIIFITMAGLILLIACFNLTNTTIATTAKRAKEVGIRKVVGATRGQLVVQFLLEMVAMILLSVIVGLAISNILVDEFTSMWNLPFGLADLSGLNLIIALLFLVFITALIAGLYPAIRSSSFQPVQLINKQAKTASYSLLSKILVGLQFAISVIVLLNGIAFIKNTKFQEGISFGFNLKEVYGVFIQSEAEYNILKARLADNPDIKQMGITHHQLGMSSYSFPLKVDTAEYDVRHIEIGESFFEIMDLPLVQGRYLDFNLSTDRSQSIVVNEQFLTHTGISADEALNRYVRVRDQRLRIVGVVANHVDNLFRTAETEPFVYYASKPNEYQMMLVKADEERLSDVQETISVVWKEEFPDKPFQGEYQEELTLGGLRQTNNNLKKIFIFLTILGGLLSAAGIFALATLHTERRTKEIGIRKALGGSLNHILFLLSKEFIWILSLAAIVGVSIGYVLSMGLMDEIYAYHIEIDVLTMLLSAFIIVAVGILTTSFIIYKSAIANPVKSLRDE